MLNLTDGSYIVRHLITHFKIGQTSVSKVLFVDGDIPTATARGDNYKAIV